MSIEEKIKTAKQDSWLKDSVSEKEFKEIKDNERRMTRKEIIDGLKFTVDMFLFDPSTGETFTEPRNDMDKTTIDACKCAIELLEQTDGDLISRKEVLKEGAYYSNRPTHTFLKDVVKVIPAIPHTDYENYEAFGWCKGCKEYDTEKHCCHRYSSFIRESLNENINAVLEDIKAEIEALETYEYDDFIRMRAVLDIIEKHISGKDCRDCIEWGTCPCGEKGHDNGTSQGYSIGECKDFKHISGKDEE